MTGIKRYFYLNKEFNILGIKLQLNRFDNLHMFETDVEKKHIS